MKETEDAVEIDEVPGEVPQVKDKEEEQERVDYTGCQVWKVSTTKSGAKRIINKLASEKRKYSF